MFYWKERENDNNNYIHLSGKYYYFDKMGITFVNERIELDECQKNIIKE